MRLRKLVLPALAVMGLNVEAVARVSDTLAETPDSPPVGEELAGELPDGEGPFRLAKPANWNGVVILDLDFAARPDAPLYQKMHEMGYAGAGSTRGKAEGGGTAVDNPARIARQLDVLTRFEEKFGPAERVISFGLSGAGGLALALMEAAPDKVDGSVAACIITGSVGWFNSKLDAAFAARTLLAPDSELRLQNMPLDLTETAAAWTSMLGEAQATPEGRARIALANTLGQLPIWSDPRSPEPERSDLAAVQLNMYETLVAQFGAEIGGQVRVRRDFERSSGGPISWNVGVDYTDMFETVVTKERQDIVRSIYEDAGLDLEADLQRLDQAERVAADPEAVQRADKLLGVTAQPRNPVLLLHTTGDGLAPPATLEAYTRRVSPDLAQIAMVRAAGHCTFTVAESMEAIETVDRRIVNGAWPDMSAQAMNERAQAAYAQPTRFVPHDMGPFGRAFYTGDLPPTFEHVSSD